MIADALAAFAEILTPPFRAVLWKVLGLTAALLVLVLVGLHHGLLVLLVLPYPWLQTVLSIVAGFGLLVGSVFLVAPVSAIVAGFFVDDLAGKVERDIDPLGPPGTALSAARSLVLGFRFAALSIVITIVALLLLLVPGLNAIAFLAANAYLFGRQYFEFAALRFRSPEETADLRRRHWLRILAAGLLIAVFVSVPLLNLLTPMFGTSLMVRVYKRVDRTPRFG